MKRCRELRKLSDDHHHGLVLARKARRTDDDASSETVLLVWQEIEGKFREELEPHFQIEETFLVPPLLETGESQLISTLLEDHRQIRSLIANHSARTIDDLHRFGVLLDRHIHFEERDVFEIAQQKLSPDDLTKIEAACKKG